MAYLVNILARLQEEIYGSGITLSLEKDQVQFLGPAGSSCLRLVRLYRASSDDIEREAAANVLLVLTSPTQAAIRSSVRHNHLLLPGGRCRIIAPGVALIRDVQTVSIEESRQVRLMGRTGVIAESLLLGGKKEWSIRDLAANANVSTALVHRVLTRLEHEAILIRHGEGPKTTRILSNPQALAELWSQEETAPKPVLRGFLYGASTEALAQKVLKGCPGSALGGILAANLYKPVLTRVNPPIRFWIPEAFSPTILMSLGFQQTDSGANIEFVQAKENPWKVHMSSEGLAKVSNWRAWVEISRTEGRTQELAEALLADMEKN